MAKIRLILIFILLYPFNSKGNTKVYPLFQEGVKNYNSGYYEKAYNSFKEIIDNGTVNGYILYNIGNSAYRLGRIGEAILRFRQAQLFLPFFDDLKWNLNLARKKVKDKFELNYWTRFKNASLKVFSLPPELSFWIFVIFNGIFWGILTLSIYKKNFKKWIIPFLIIYLYGLGSFLFTCYRIYIRKDGVVLADVVRVYSGTDIASSVLFELHEGTEFKIINKRGEWLAIKVPDGRKGWLKKESAGVVQDERIIGSFL